MLGIKRVKGRSRQVGSIQQSAGGSPESEKSIESGNRSRNAQARKPQAPAIHSSIRPKAILWYLCSSAFQRFCLFSSTVSGLNS